MKKVILTAALILGGLTTFATSAITFNQTDKVVMTTQEEFKEVKAEELPQAVKDAFAKDFKAATLKKASVNAEQLYKLEIIVDGKEYAIHADKDGNWIKKD